MSNKQQIDIGGILGIVLMSVIVLVAITMLMPYFIDILFNAFGPTADKETMALIAHIPLYFTLGCIVVCGFAILAKIKSGMSGGKK